VFAANEHVSDGILDGEECARDDHEKIERLETAQCRLDSDLRGGAHFQGCRCRSEADEGAHLDGFRRALKDAVEAEPHIVETDLQPGGPDDAEVDRIG